jgi:hypothetical protein
MRGRLAVLCGLLGLMLSVPAGLAAAPADAAAGTPPQVEAVYVDQPPVIDGTLDDACWAEAAKLSDFYVLTADQPLPEETTAFVCVDSTAIYLGVICQDRTPDDIRAVETRRNGDVWNEDCVYFEVDPWNQHRDTYAFLVNARGTQSDIVPGGSATKTEWRGDWQGAAVRTPDGYQVEMAIPFSILRYPPGQTTFGFSVSRFLAEERLWLCYPDAGRPWNSLLAADLVGLHPPSIRPRPLFMPYVTLGAGEGTRRFDTGLDVQYKLPNGLTALGSLNPDYSQIEQVVEPISFSYTERYLPEVRPFFVTGQDVYFPNARSFYSNRIQDFDLGVKVFGTIGDDTYGLLDAVTYGSENSVAGAWQHQFTPDAYARLMLVDHEQADGPSNLIYGLTTARTWRHPDSGDNIWTVLYPAGSYELGGSHWSAPGALGWNWRLARVEADYQPALGYVVDQNTQGGECNLNWSNQYEKGALLSRGWNAGVSYYPYLTGGLYSSGVSGAYDWEWRNGRLFEIAAGTGKDHDQRSADVNFTLGWNWRSLYYRGHLFALRGTQAGGEYTWITVAQGFRPTQHLSVALGGGYAHLAPPSPDAYHAYQTVVTASYDLTTEKSVAARLVAQDGGINVFAAYRQVVRRGMDAYVLLGDPNPQHTGFTNRVVVKLIWAF